MKRGQRETRTGLVEWRTQDNIAWGQDGGAERLPAARSGSRGIQCSSWARTVRRVCLKRSH